MKTKTSHTLYAYWNEIRGSRMAPHRFEVEPAQIAAILPETFILERSENNAFMFRLAGTRICETFGREFRGFDIQDLWSAEDAANFDRVLRSVTFEGSVGEVLIDATTPTGRSVRFEIVLLPLVHTGNTVGRILGSMSLLDIPPVWLGTEPLVEQAVRYVSMIWPDGRPHSVIQKSERQPPFSPHPQHKRVVSIERRNFRVYEGGRSELGTAPVPPTATNPTTKT